MIPHVDIEDGKVTVDYDGHRVGDLVHKGAGKRVWRITSFWSAGDVTMAALMPTEKGKYTNGSAPVEALRKAQS